MLKEFKVEIHIDGHYTIEDPKCPSEWKGSGCYDIDVPTWADVELEVWAESAEQAAKFAEEYEGYVDEWCIEIEEVIVEKVEFVKDLEGRDAEEAGVIEGFRINWKEEDEDLKYHIL